MRGPLGDPDREIREEIRHHIDECADLLMAKGWKPEEARREAERRFGDADRVRRELGELERRGAWIRALAERLRTVGTNVRYALRSLRLNPGFAVAVVLTLGLGAGVATSMFAVVDAVALRPLPYADAERWVEAMARRPDGRVSQGQSAEAFQGWREAGDGFADGWVGFHRFTAVRTGGVAGEPLPAVAVTPEAPSLLGVPLLMGRAFSPEEGEPGAASVVLLGRDYWARSGADPDVVGSTLYLDTGPVTVIGVLAGEVKVPDYGPPSDLWFPLPRDLVLHGRELGGLQGAWARLRSGVSLEEAQERADATAETLQEDRPLEGGWGVELQPLGSRRDQADTGRALWLLGATGSLILLIALVNGVNLLLVRATARVREFAVRRAMGASRTQLLGQLLVEGLVLGILGGVVAAVMAILAVEAVSGGLPGRMAFFSPHLVTVGSRTLAFAFGTAFLAGTLFGLVPALQLLGAAPHVQDRGASDHPGLRRGRRLAVVGQVALATLLLFGAGLFLRSAVALLSEDPGFDFSHTAMAQVELPGRSFSGEERALLLDRIARETEALPGVAAASYAGGVLFSFSTALEAESGRTAEEEPDIVPMHMVAPGYLEATGIRLVAGRGLDASDRGRDVAVVDRDLAGLLWGPGSPVGGSFRIDADGPWLEVVGVVEELRLMGRDQRDGPFQLLRPLPEDGPLDFVRIFARTTGDPSGVLPELRRTIGSIVPTAPIYELQTGAQLLAESESQPRFLLTVMGVLGVVAVLLATVGLYGVLAYSVRRRTRELGVRMALGASAASLLRMVLSEGMAVALAGIGLGLLGAYLFAGVAEALLYGISPRDPWAFLATAALFLAVALAASLLPARRATSVDPVRSLKVE